MKTTRELAKEETHKQLVQNLQELLAKNYDANKGFKTAMKEARDPNLKEYLKVQALIHHRYATQLDKIIHSLNAVPIKEGSAAGRVHRVWMNVILSINGHEDKTVFEECQRGQKATLKEYQTKLKENKFPAEIKEIIKRQLLELENIYREIESLQDLK